MVSESKESQEERMNQRLLSATELSRRIKNGNMTVMDAVELVYKNIEEKEKEYHCYITIKEKEKALEEARRLQQEIAAGKYADSPIAGVPVAIKDNLCVEGQKMTCASKMLKEFVAPYTAEAVQRLLDAGTLIVGKTNMDEFSMGNTTTTSYFGATRNPVAPECVPGGSSGGSAAAVAAGECFFALGSETGGSVRQPAAHCGLVGLKPTYGMVSRYGMVAYASSLDQIGPLAVTVEDCAAVLSVIAGKDEKDSTSIECEDYDFLSGMQEGIKGRKVALPKEYLAEGIRAEIKDALCDTVKKLRAEGAEIFEIELGMTEYLVPMYYIIAAAEASSNLARFDGVKYGHRTAKLCEGPQEMTELSRAEGFGKEVKKRILLGTNVLYGENYEKYYRKALKAKQCLAQRFAAVFAEYDYILAPVAPTTAPELGEKKTQMQSYLEDIYTVPANLTGIPAISVPAGKDEKGRPIGIQLMADRFCEKKLIQAAWAIEQYQEK